MKTHSRPLATLAIALIAMLASTFVAAPTAEAAGPTDMPGWTEDGVVLTAGMGAELKECLRIQAELQMHLDMTPVPGTAGILLVPFKSVASIGMLTLFNISLEVSDWDELNCKELLKQAGY